MENIAENKEKDKLELELSSTTNQMTPNVATTSSESDDSDSSATDVIPTNVVSVQVPPPIVKVDGRSKERSPAQLAQFAASKAKRSAQAKIRKLELQKRKEMDNTLREIDEMKAELKRREILQEAEKLRSLIQTAAPVSLTSNPNTIGIVQTQVDTPISETKMSNNAQFQLEITEAPIHNIKSEDEKRQCVSPVYHEEKYAQENIDISRNMHVISSRATSHSTHHDHMERSQEPQRYGAANRGKEQMSYAVDDDDNLEYAEILAEAKRVVGERRRLASMRVASEAIPIPQERLKVQRPSEASRNLQHTQTTTNQQFSQRVMPKPTNEEFIWL